MKIIAALLIFSSLVYSKNNIDKKDYSYTLIDLESSKVVDNHNPDTPMILASVSKLFTTYFALSTLGSDYRFKTQVFIDSKDNLYLRGSGAPYLTANGLISLIHQIKEQGISKIKGNFYVDDSELAFTPRLSSIGLEDQPDNPSMGALNVEFNRFSVWGKGKLPHPPLKHISLEKKTSSSNGLKFKNLTSAGNEKWQVYAKEKIKFIEDVPVRDSTIFTGEYFRYLAGLHGLILPKPKRMKITKNVKEIAKFKGLELSRLVDLGIEYSNNLIAEALLKTSVKKMKKLSLNSLESSKLMHKWLKEKLPQVNWNKSKFENGSGLTLNNKVTSKTMSEYLSSIASTQFGTRSFWSSLSINAHSGSLARRLTHPSMAYRIYGKSGSLYYVNNLAGFLIGKSGKRYAYSIFTTDKLKREKLNSKNSKENNRLRKRSKAWHKESTKLQDKIISKWIKTN